MKAHVLRGTKQEIAESLTRIDGDVREAIVFEEEPQVMMQPLTEAGKLFAEMEPYMINVETIEDSREGIYSRTAEE